MENGLAFLERRQRPDGAWVPLWFGNQAAPEQKNPVYGTARVLECYADLGLADSEPAGRGTRFLLRAQNSDGSWGGAPGVAGSVEETGLALGALAGMPPTPEVRKGCRTGARRLAECIMDGGLDRPAPIGLYFARLWYSESLYPAIWAVSGLGRWPAKTEAVNSRDNK